MNFPMAINVYNTLLTAVDYKSCNNKTSLGFVFLTNHFFDMSSINQALVTSWLADTFGQSWHLINYLQMMISILWRKHIWIMAAIAKWLIAASRIKPLIIALIVGLGERQGFPLNRTIYVIAMGFPGRNSFWDFLAIKHWWAWLVKL